MVFECKRNAGVDSGIIGLAGPACKDTLKGDKVIDGEKGRAGLKAFPIDIFGVKRFGVEKWQKTFFWPVSDQEFFSLIDRIGDIFYTEIQKGSRTLRDILLSNFGLIQQYGMFLHALMVLERLNKTGHEILFLDETQYYSEMLTGKPRHQPGRTETGSIDRAKDRIKQLLKFLLKNRFNPSSLRKTFTDNSVAVSLGSFVRLKREYCDRNHLLVTHKSGLDFLKWAVPDSRQGFAEIEGALKKIVDDLEILLKDLEFKLESYQKTYLYEMGNAMLNPSYSIYQGLVQNYPKRIDLLLLAEVAKPLHKTICFALKRKFNTRVVGFEHGNTFGSQLTRNFSLTELSHCDEYVVASSQSIPNFREAQRAAGLPYGVETRIKSVNTDYYRRLAEKNKALPLPEKIGRVMLLGFPMNQNRYMDFPGHFSLFHLDLELRLLDFMKQRGFAVAYKAHPDRLKEVRGIFEGVADEIIAEPFEKVYNTTDAFLFPQTDTSTFGIALCTKKPIVVIEIEGKPWRGNARELVSKRCRMVSAWIDEKCRIFFDEQALEKALSRNPAEPNMEYLEKMMAS